MAKKLLKRFRIEERFVGSAEMVVWGPDEETVSRALEKAEGLPSDEIDLEVADEYITEEDADSDVDPRGIVTPEGDFLPYADSWLGPNGEMFEPTDDPIATDNFQDVPEECVSEWLEKHGQKKLPF